MKRILFFILLSAFATSGCARLPPVKSSVSPLTGMSELEPFGKGERVLIMAPHPDDETIGCAGIIQKALAAGAEVNVVYLTNGDYNQASFIVYEKRLTFRTSEFIHMGEVRHQEAVKAMKLLGLDESRLVFLGYPDFGTFAIFRYFWQSKRPYKSMLTRISHVPYKRNLSFGAPYNAESILADIKEVLKRYRPDKIFVSHPSDTNVDHRALYLFLQVALCDLKDQIPVPKVYPYLIHCPGWPVPRHYHPELELAPPKQYPADGKIQWLKSGLSSGELGNKHRTTLCYKSQTEISAFYLLAFARQNELFGNYPELVLNLKKEISASAKAKDSPELSIKMDMAQDYGIDTPDYILEQEKNKIRVSYEYDENFFYIKINKASGLSKKFGTLIYLFSYSYKTPFAQMPKICIMSKGRKFKISDARNSLKAKGVELSLSSRECIIKIPSGLVKDPDIILTSLRAYDTKPRVHSIGLRKIIIKRR